MALKKYNDLELGRNHQVDNSEVNEIFGEINICRIADGIEVYATILANPEFAAEGWRTAVAIDCSFSMYVAFGGTISTFARCLTDEEISRYRCFAYSNLDNNASCDLPEDVYQDLKSQSIIVEKQSDNEVEKVCQKVLPMLARSLDAHGVVCLLYCCAGIDGSQYSIEGELSVEAAANFSYSGTPGNWGTATKILPAIKTLMERYATAKGRFFVFITDGALDDFEEVKAFTIQLSQDIAAKREVATKLILIGVGNKINIKQLEELDDLPDTMDLPIDVWDHKIAKEMRSVNDIFAELVNEYSIVFDSAMLYDLEGRLIHAYTDGMPALVKFRLPSDATGFKIVLPSGDFLEQKILN